MIDLLTSKQIHRLQVIALLILLVCASSLASKTFQPVYKPSLEITKATKSIEIDGDLNDGEWKSFVRERNFVERQPGDMVQPAVETEVMITYDDDNLYVAYLCYDDPETIRATMCERDRFYGDDAVCLLIDTYGNATWAYEFFVNPYGVQKDNLWSSVAGEDRGYDLIWKSAAQITDSGYQVEMAIPFASLRFPNKDVQNWRVDFWRNRPRETFNQYSWAAYDRNEQCWPCQWGTVEGIKNVSPGKGLEILPTMVANQAGNYSRSKSEFDDGPVKGELSLGGKYSVSSDVTLEATYNPDFSQIESDAQQIDVNATYALLYPERRPFFQEGSDIFRTLFNSFYTRTINDPEFAAKFTGRLDKTTFGYMIARDETTPYISPMDYNDDLTILGKSTTNVLRGLRSVGENSQLGFMITDRRIEGGGSGSIAAVDGIIRLTRNYSIDGQFLYSHTKEPDLETVTIEPGTLLFDSDRHTIGLDGESFQGNAFISRFKRRARNWNFTIDYNQIDPTYRSQSGYDPINNHRTISISSSYTFYFDKGIFERITPSIYASERWNFTTGSKKFETLNLSLGSRFSFAQSYASISFSKNPQSYRFFNDDSHAYEEMWFEDPWRVGFNVDTRPYSQIGVGIYASYGKGIAYSLLSYGNVTSLSAYTDLKPIDRLIIEPSYNYYNSSNTKNGQDLLSQNVFRMRVRYQATRELSLRLVLQHNKVKYFISDDYGYYMSERIEVDPLITYRISSFTLFYVGSTTDFEDYTHTPDVKSLWRMSSRQFFMKLQYLFQA
jgi:hypothetical protein